LANFKRELDLARHARAEILAEEELLYSEEVAALLATSTPGITADEVRSLEQSGLLLALHDYDRALFPRFQFDETGTRFPAIALVNQVLRRDGGGWGIVAWWRRPRRGLDGRSPKDVLGEHEPEFFLDLAQSSALGT
jgi:hypothetical protein